MPDLRIVFRALRHRNYRLFCSGQSLSLIGTWMQRMAVAWLVYRLTHSVFLLGVVGFAMQVPAFLLSPFAGVIADRYNRHRLLVVTQVMAMVQAFVLAALVLANVVTVWEIIALSFFLGMINAFDIPVRQSFVIEMVDDKEDLGNAIALNSSMVNMARLIGPSLGGVLIAVAGEGVCFLLNGISYIAVIASLLAMRVRPRERTIKRGRVLSQIREGFAYAYGFIPIRVLLLLLGMMSLVAGGLRTLLPVFAKDIFHGGSQTFGVLMAATGCGALAGAIYLAGRRTVRGLGRVIARVSALFGLGVMAFALSGVFWLSLVLAFVVGFGMMVQLASSNTLLQSIVDEDKRGRVMSFYAMSFVGTAPLGSLLAGGLAAHWGVRPVLLAGGVLCLAGSTAFRAKLPLLREKIRPIYAQKGIIPQVAEGLGAAAAEGAPRN